jgi:hypothetical protein
MTTAIGLRDLVGGSSMMRCPCGKELVGKQRRWCSKRCGTRHRVRVHRAAELPSPIIAMSSDLPDEVFGVACDPLVAACFYDDLDRMTSFYEAAQHTRPFSPRRCINTASDATTSDAALVVPPPAARSEPASKGTETARDSR